MSTLQLNINIQSQKVRSQITMVFLGGLIFLRIPFLTGIACLVHPTPLWLDSVFSYCTFLITALLIFWERNYLSDFNFDSLALYIFIFTPFVEQIMRMLIIPYTPFENNQINWIYMIISFLLLLTFVLTKTKIKQINLKSLIGVLIGILVGLVIGTMNGFLLQLQNNLRSDMQASFSIFIINSLSQIQNAALIEEPLFRGFLWGYLRKFGFDNYLILFIQTGLFVVGHTYYIGRYPISLLIVLIGGLVLGIIAWKSRTIASSIFAHGLSNAVADLVAHFKW